MNNPKSVNDRPVLAAIGLALCACIIALPPLLLWLVIALDILGYALLTGFIVILVLTARANLGGRRSSAFFSNNPLHWHPSAGLERADVIWNRHRNRDRGRSSGWKAAYQLDNMGALSRLKASDTNTCCAVCAGKVHVGNLGSIYRRNGEAVFVCSRPACLEAASAGEQKHNHGS
jgi:hypothetical protein